MVVWGRASLIYSRIFLKRLLIFYESGMSPAELLKCSDCFRFTILYNKVRHTESVESAVESGGREKS